jgi:hypothetical protein
MKNWFPNICFQMRLVPLHRGMVILQVSCPSLRKGKAMGGVKRDLNIYNFDADAWRDSLPERRQAVGRCTLTPPNPYTPVAERRLVSTLAPIK